MVAVNKNKAGPKTDKQHKLEDIRNRQTCSMRYRKELKVSMKQAPWEGKKDEQTTS